MSREETIEKKSLNDSLAMSNQNQGITLNESFQEFKDG